MQMSTEAYTYLPSLDDYIETLTNIILGGGLGFELPAVAYILSKSELLHPKCLKLIEGMPM